MPGSGSAMGGEHLEAVTSLDAHLRRQPDAGRSLPVSLLELRGITAGYGTTSVVRSVSLSVPPGSVVALLGANGAGKTTLLRVASGQLRPSRGVVSIDGVDVTRTASHQRARAGLCLVPEGRGIFRALTVADNLRIWVPPWSSGGSGIERALEAFPVLKKRLAQVAGTMSGGEQQMLALARTFLCSPRVVLLDEVSTGLAPVILDEIFASLRLLADSGASLLVVEQYVSRALELADRVVLLDKGSVSFTGPPGELDQSIVLQNYLGAASTPDRSGSSRSGEA